MKVDDEIRLNILSALLKQGSVSANIKQIQKHTGYHKATIKASLDFLIRGGLVTGFGPKVDFKKFGFKIEALTFFQADLTNKELLQKFLSAAEGDSNLYYLSGLVGSGNFNVIARHIYNDIESFHAGMNKKYFESIDGIHDFVKDKEVFYFTEPLYKNVSRTGSLIEIIRKNRGFE